MPPRKGSSPDQGGPVGVIVEVRITAAYPELTTDLAGLPPRARPERLRHLAAAGLAALRNGGLAAAAPQAAPAVASAEAPTPAPDAPVSNLRKHLLRSAGRPAAS